MHVAYVPNRKLPPTILLRETYRKDGKVMHRTIGNITHLPAETIEQLKIALAGKKLVAIDSIFSIKRSKPHGHVEAILNAIRQLGLDRMIDSKPSRKRNLVLAMIAQRIIQPCSKLGTVKVWNDSTLAEELELQKCDQDDLYDAMDWLAMRQPAIEKKIAAKHLKNSNLALYDLSSSYVEGEKNENAKHGHSRDKKKGKKIITYGLLSSGIGVPVSIQLYPGNTADSTTVPDQTEKLQNQFGLNEIILVGDRGMITGTQIKNLEKYPSIKYITALRGDSVRKLIEQGKVDRSLFDEQNLAEIYSDEYPGERLIVCFNPLLQRKRQYSREDLIATTEKQLQELKDSMEKRTESILKSTKDLLDHGTKKKKIYTDSEVGLRVGKIVNKLKVGKHFKVHPAKGSFSFERNKESIEKEAIQDGFYIIRTNVDAADLSAADSVRNYKRLGDVEKSFRTMKTTLLEVRPIFHYREPRVRAHFFICMLAYYVTYYLREAWSEFLFVDGNLNESRDSRDPVLAAQPSDEVKSKKLSGVKHSDEESDFSPMNFRALLGHLATRCRNECEAKSGPKDNRTVYLQTEMTSLQDKLLAKVKMIGQLLSPSPEAGTSDEEASGTEFSEAKVSEEPTSAETVSEE